MHAVMPNWTSTLSLVFSWASKPCMCAVIVCDCMRLLGVSNLEMVKLQVIGTKQGHFCESSMYE